MSAQSPLLGPTFGLIETLLWTPAGGFWLKDLHEARLKASAAALGFTHDPAAFAYALDQSVFSATGPSRVRLALGFDGSVEATRTVFEPPAPNALWRVALAPQRFDSSDKLLRHKTTRRELYEKPLAASGADEVIFLNEREEVCEGARTNIFVERDGRLLTPPLASGLLPGVFRAHLLAQGRAREAVLRLADLRDGFFVGNSLRGLISARLE
jgi:branched-subunit amino acid aminotransferase/4-amino-4-deoxychorismate lyase